MPRGRSPPPRLRDRHPPHRIGPIGLRHEFLAQARQPRLHARRVNLLEGRPVHPRRARIGAGQRIGVPKDVVAADLVVEDVEAESGLRLRLTIELSLKVPDLFGRFEAHRQSPPPRRLRKRIRSQGPFLRRNYPASQVVRPCPTPARSAAKHTASKPRPPTARVSPDYPHHPSNVPFPIPRWIGTGASVDCFPVHPAFPVVPAGRHPYLHFRGLLRLYSRYGPLDRSTAQGGLCHEASARPVTQPNRSSATGLIDNYPGGTSLHWQHAPSGRTRTCHRISRFPRE